MTATLPETPGPVGQRLRVMSFNVRSLRDDAAAVAEVVRAAQPDVVAVQEAPRFLRWRSRCAALAREAGLVVVGGGRPAGANLLLSRLAVTVHATHDVRLPWSPPRHRRGAALAHLSLAGHRFALLGTHLSLDADERGEHLPHLLAAVDRAALFGPVVLAADVNETPDGATWRALAHRLTDAGPAEARTYPATGPQRRIDGVFADRRLEVVSAQVPGGAAVLRASDHRPVVVELALPHDAA